MSWSAIGDRFSISGIGWEKTPGRRRPALWAAVLLSFGIVLVRYAQFSPLFWGILAFAALIAILTFGRQKPAALFFAMIGLWLALGAFRYAAQTKIMPADHVSHYLDPAREVEIFGRVVDVPDRRLYATNLVIDLGYLKEDGRKILTSGRVLARVSDTTKRFSYGDFLRFSGRLQKPHVARNPGGFDYRRHLLNRGIYGVVRVAKNRRVRVYPDPRGAAFYNRLIIPLREYILAKFREYLPGVSGTLLAGYLIGETREMPDWLYKAYRRSGTLHLLAVSGSNVWLVLGVFWLVFRRLRFPRIVQTVLLLLILLVFCFITRNEPSVIRAGLMATLILLGRLFYRRLDLLNIVGVSAVIILLFSPRHLFFAGFQLSYAAVLGILVIVPRLLQLFPRIGHSRSGRWLLGLAGSSIAATTATAPILAMHFGTIPVISVVANLVMVPLAVLVTNCAVVLILLGDLWPQAARLVAWLADLLAIWSIHSARFFQTLPVGQVFWPQPGALGIANYALVLAAVTASRYWYRWLKPAVFYALLAGVVFAAAKATSDPSPAGEVVFLDAGMHPLVGLKLPGDKLRLVGTTSAFSAANHQWVIQPYAIHSGWPQEDFDYDTLPSPTPRMVPGYLIDSVSSIDISARGPEDGIQHVRFYGESKRNRADCLVADYLACGKGRILIVYESDPELLDYIRRFIPLGRVDILAVRSCLPSTPFKKVLGDFTFGELILFGALPRFSPGTIHHSWARQVPGHPVFSTRKNGGIRVALSSEPAAVPTIR